MFLLELKLELVEIKLKIFIFLKDIPPITIFTIRKTIVATETGAARKLFQIIIL
jgi:hypothetical protein